MHCSLDHYEGSLNRRSIHILIYRSLDHYAGSFIQKNMLYTTLLYGLQILQCTLQCIAIFVVLQCYRAYNCTYIQVLQCTLQCIAIFVVLQCYRAYNCTYIQVLQCTLQCIAIFVVLQCYRAYNCTYIQVLQCTLQCIAVLSSQYPRYKQHCPSSYHHLLLQLVRMRPLY